LPAKPETLINNRNSEVADLANLTVRETIDLLLDRGVKGNIRADQQRKALDFITKP